MNLESLPLESFCQPVWLVVCRWRKEIYYSTFASDDNIYDARWGACNLASFCGY